MRSAQTRPAGSFRHAVSLVAILALGALVACTSTSTSTSPAPSTSTSAPATQTDTRLAPSGA
ncbi:MAG: hypothetical protein ABIQ39_07385, partial [Ilumatobacteraceae bacterium]